MSNPEIIVGARKALAHNIQQLRKNMGVSQERLAEMAGLHRTYVSQLERAVTNPTLDSIERLANVLSVPTADLLKSPGAV